MRAPQPPHRSNRLSRYFSGGLRLTYEIQRVAIELRIVRHPAASNGVALDVHGMAFGELRVGRYRRVLGEISLVTPLAAIDVVPGRRLLPAGRLRPVQCKRDGGPRSLRRELLLADVVIPPTAVLQGEA